MLALACLSVAANDLEKTQRRQILDAARPVASEKAGQPVRLKVDKLNVDGDWALLVGNLVSASGKGMDWRLASECNPVLDKMLWVVLKRRQGAWRVKHIDICAPEPPYWYLNDYGGLVWPCGVYAGLEDGGEETIEQRCRNQALRRR